jgi:hypothetical protein
MPFNFERLERWLIRTLASLVFLIVIFFDPDRIIYGMCSQCVHIYFFQVIPACLDNFLFYNFIFSVRFVTKIIIPNLKDLKLIYPITILTYDIIKLIYEIVKLIINFIIEISREVILLLFKAIKNNLIKFKKKIKNETEYNESKSSTHR